MTEPPAHISQPTRFSLPNGTSGKYPHSYAGGAFGESRKTPDEARHESLVILAWRWSRGLSDVQGSRELHRLPIAAASSASSARSILDGFPLSAPGRRPAPR